MTGANVVVPVLSHSWWVSTGNVSGLWQQFTNVLPRGPSLTWSNYEIALLNKKKQKQY